MTYRTLLNISGAVVALSLSACAVQAQDTDKLSNKNKEQLSASADDLTVGPQITSEDLPPSSILFVDQVANTKASQSYAFSDLEGDDPCLHGSEKLGTPQCEIAPRNNSARTSPQSRSSDNALSDLQTITPRVIDPGSFDPTRTADELGRNGRTLQSQAGMALGAKLLAPPPVVEPETPEENINPQTGFPLPPGVNPQALTPGGS